MGKKSICSFLIIMIVCLCLPYAVAEENKVAEVRLARCYNDYYYNILGIDKAEGITNAFSAIDTGVFALIAGHGYANTISIIAKNGEMCDINSTDILWCYKFPRISPTMIMPEKNLRKIRRYGVDAVVPDNEPPAMVCSAIYSAWYNTTIINYAFMNQEVLLQYRNQTWEDAPALCLPDRPLENVDIFQLWDSEKQPAPGIPEYPW